MSEIQPPLFCSLSLPHRATFHRRHVGDENYDDSQFIQWHRACVKQPSPVTSELTAMSFSVCHNKIPTCWKKTWWMFKFSLLIQSKYLFSNQTLKLKNLPCDTVCETWTIQPVVISSLFESCCEKPSAGRHFISRWGGQTTSDKASCREVHAKCLALNQTSITSPSPPKV